jgi:hypothetical protein
MRFCFCTDMPPQIVMMLTRGIGFVALSSDSVVWPGEIDALYTTSPTCCRTCKANSLVGQRIRAARGRFFILVEASRTKISCRIGRE